jgi:hypothetical protein
MRRVEVDTRRALLCEPWFQTALATQLPFAHCHLTSPPKQHLHTLSRPTLAATEPGRALSRSIVCC